MKRDDLLPEAGGGNKVRKLSRILTSSHAEGYDAFVTTGGLQSNHARVAAIFAARLGLHCSLVLHGDPAEIKRPNGNFLLMQMAGATIEIVRSSDISQAMRLSLQQLKEDGFNPLEIPGGGHCLDGALAYVDAVHELERQYQDPEQFPEWIIHASGTGTTQAGLVAGVDAVGWRTRVLGISVARTNPRGRNIVEKSYEELCTELDIPFYPDRIDFRDAWICGGYEQANEKIFNAIRLAAQMDGLILDPTYTGKAFAALLDLVKAGEITSGSRVLFWHTGGLLNLMTNDYMKEIVQS